MKKRTLMAMGFGLILSASAMASTSQATCERTPLQKKLAVLTIASAGIIACRAGVGLIKTGYNINELINAKKYPTEASYKGGMVFDEENQKLEADNSAITPF